MSAFKRFAAVIALLAILMLPLAAGAATFRSGESYDLGENDAVEGNLYAAAANLVINGAVEGDAMVAGANLTVIGPVGGDLFSAGGSQTLLGPVGGDLRTIGGTLTIGNTVGGELLAAGGNLTVLPTADVAGDAHVAGGMVTLKGNFGGDLTVAADRAEIDGTVEGDVHSIATVLTLGPGAVIKGKLVHEGPAKPMLGAGAVVQGENVYTYKRLDEGRVRAGGTFPKEKVGRAVAGAFAAIAIVKALSCLAAALLATLLFARRSKTIVDRTLGNFGVDLLTGFLTVIVAPVATVLLLATVIGGYVAGILAASLALAGMLGAVYAPVSVGALARKLAAKGRPAAADWKSALLGGLILAAAAFVPLVGWLFVCVFFLASFGSVLRLAYAEIGARR